MGASHLLLLQRNGHGVQLPGEGKRREERNIGKEKRVVREGEKRRGWQERRTRKQEASLSKFHTRSKEIVQNDFEKNRIPINCTENTKTQKAKKKNGL